MDFVWDRKCFGESMRFVHLTDLHVVARSKPPLYALDPAERLRLAVADIIARHGADSAAPATFVLVTGDLVHDGGAEEYSTLHEALAPLPMPVFLTLGNHDERSLFRSAFPSHPVDSHGFIQFAVDAGPCRVLALDTHVPGRPHGELCRDRLGWLAEELDGGSQPVILALHHPPVAIGLTLMDGIRLRDSEALWTVLEPHRARIRHLLFGHTHRPIAGSWRGIPFSNGYGLSHQIALDFALKDGVRGSHEPPTYALVELTETDVVVHSHNFLDRTATFLL